MSCNIPVQDGVKSPADCKCYGAVMRAYGALVASGQPTRIALDAARIVYGYHHPEDSYKNQALTVERWVHQESLH